jgi:hypothetical protein
VRAQLGVGDAALLELDLHDRPALGPRPRDDAGEVVALVSGQGEQPDVVQQRRREGVVAVLAVRQQPARDLCDAHGAALHGFQVEPLDAPRRRKSLERVGREHQAAQRRQPQVDGGRAHVGDPTAQPEPRRVDQRQDLRRHRDVTLDDRRGVGGRRAAVAQQRRQLCMQTRRRRQSRRACGKRAQGARALHQPRELVDVARLGQEAMSDRRGPRDHVALSRPREHDAHRVRLPSLDVAQQRRPVHPVHAHVRDDHVVDLALEPIQRILAAGRERHLPLVPARAQRVAQAVEHPRLVVDEQHAPHAATSFTADTRSATGSRTWNVVPCPDWVSKSILRPWRSTTIWRAIASPCPVPRPTSFVVKNGS